MFSCAVSSTTSSDSLSPTYTDAHCHVPTRQTQSRRIPSPGHFFFSSLKHNLQICFKNTSGDSLRSTLSAGELLKPVLLRD